MATAPPQQLRSPARSVVADFVTLTKPRIMLLILITAYGAMAFAAGGFPPADVTIATLFGLGLSWGAYRITFKVLRKHEHTGAFPSRNLGPRARAGR